MVYLPLIEFQPPALNTFPSVLCSSLSMLCLLLTSTGLSLEQREKILVSLPLPLDPGAAAQAGTGLRTLRSLARCIEHRACSNRGSSRKLQASEITFTDCVQP